MTLVPGFSVALAFIGSAVGYGYLFARLTGADLQKGTLGIGLQATVGLVILGWALFWLLLAGWTSTVIFSLILLPGLVGVTLNWRALVGGLADDFRHAWPLLIVAGLLFTVDMLASVMPVLDADSNAYHFTLPLQFLARGELFLIPRAVDGAAPLFFQGLYALPLALGGELAMVASAKLMVWVMALMIYGVVRKLSNWWLAGALALLMLTMPAVIYGMSAGQVEARIALLTLAAAIMIWKMRDSPGVGNAVIVGLLCGGVAAAKFTGLLFVAAAGLVFIAVARRPALIAAAALAGLVAGGQWYLWLWIETGSPVFPMLAGLPYWDAEHAAEFSQRILSGEAVLPVDLTGLLTYPWHVFMATHSGFEADRTGLGPVLFALLPLGLVAGFRRFRSSAALSEAGRLIIVSLGIALLYYLLWWFFGASQRIRHLLPVVPLLLIAAGLGARAACRTRLTSSGLAVLILICLSIQAGGWAFYHRTTASFAVSGFDRDAVLRSDLLDYEAIRWMSENFTEDDLLVLMERRNNFYLGQPFYRISSDLERLVSHGRNDTDPTRFLADLNALGATYVLFHLLDNPAFSLHRDGSVHILTLHDEIDNLSIEGNGIGRFHQLTMKLLRDGCGDIVHLSRAHRKLSRTMAQVTPVDEMVMVVKLKPQGCAYPESFGTDPVMREHTDWTGKPRRKLPGR